MSNHRSGAPDYDWRLVRSFLAALDAGSLLGAAKRLATSQPTVGRQIAALEDQLGVVLFERTGRGLTPTAAALRLADAARAMDAASAELARVTLGTQQTPLGSVRISASQPVACFRLPSILARMREAFPHIQVDLVSSNAVSNLLRREADIAVRMMPPTQATLIARKLGDVALGAFASRAFVAKHGEPRTLADVARFPLVGEDQQTVIIRSFARLGVTLTRENFVLRSDDLVVQWQAVRAGIGIGFAARNLGADDPDLVHLMPKAKIPPLPMWLVVHREIRSSPHIRAVYDFLADALTETLRG